MTPNGEGKGADPEDAIPSHGGLTHHDDIFVWGHNTWGQLGLGHLNNVPYPEPVDGLRESTVSRVSCGGHHLVLLTLQDEVWVAGKNDHNQLGISDTDDRQPLPVLLESMSGLRVERVACGYDHTVLVTNEGALWTFGHNANGELGLGHCDNVAQPQRVSSFRSARLDAAVESGTANAQSAAHVRVVEVSSKGYHTLALTTDAEVLAWGKNNFGQLGLGNTDNVAIPTEIRALRGKRVSLLACGSYHSVVLTRRDELLAFGDNNYGQLGLGDHDCRVSPEIIEALSFRGVGAVSCGFNHTMVLLPGEDAVFGFGGNQHGQLGLGHTDDQNRPRRIEAVVRHRVIQVVCGYNHTFFWTMGGGVDATGYGDGYGRRFGGGPSEKTTVVGIQGHTKGGGLLACGANNFGQLGLGESAAGAGAIEIVPVHVKGVPHTMEGRVESSRFSIVLPGRAPLQRYGEVGGSTLASDMALLLSNRELADVQVYIPAITTLSGWEKQDGLLSLPFPFSYRVLVAGGDEDQAVFPVHRAILHCRCHPLAELVATAQQEAHGSIEDTTHDSGGQFYATKNAPPPVAVPNVAGRTLRRLLRVCKAISCSIPLVPSHSLKLFVYSGLLDLRGAAPADVLLLAAAARTFGMERLECLCVREVNTMLDFDNAIIVLREASKLELLEVKRIALQFIADNFNDAVSARNREVVDELSALSELLAEVVSLSSPSLARSAVEALPTVRMCPSPTIFKDYESLLVGNENQYADAAIVPTGPDAGPPGKPPPSSAALSVHRFMLAARSPVLAKFLRIIDAVRGPPPRDDDFDPTVVESKQADGSAVEGKHIVSGEDGEEAADKVAAPKQGAPQQVPVDVRTSVEWGAARKGNVTSIEQSMATAMFAGLDEMGRVLLLDGSEAVVEAIHDFLRYIYTDSVLHIKEEYNATGVMQMACRYGLADSKLVAHCEDVLRKNMAPHSAIETLAVAHQLDRQGLRADTVHFIVDHFVQCIQADPTMLHDATQDFPAIGVEILEAVAARLANHGAGALSRGPAAMMMRPNTIESKAAQ